MNLKQLNALVSDWGTGWPKWVSRAFDTRDDLIKAGLEFSDGEQSIVIDRLRGINERFERVTSRYPYRRRQFA